jgi:hypothetical protein
MGQAKPAVILIPGVFSVSTAVYAPLVIELNKLGFTKAEPLNLPPVDTIANKAIIKPTALEQTSTLSAQPPYCSSRKA